MPTLAPFTVAPNGALPSYIFVPKVPAAGDGFPAQYRVDSIGTAPMYRPRLDIMTKSNGNKDARRVELSLVVPFVSTSGTVSTVAANMPFKLIGTIPMMVPDADVTTAVHLLQGALNSVILADVFKSGFAPT